jgi:6-pyruvoyl-tetrahydropterin synthase
MVASMSFDKREIILSRKAHLSVGVGSPLSKGGEGVNLCMEVFVKGNINPKSDLVVNLTEVDAFMSKVVEKFDHKNMPLDLGAQDLQMQTPEEVGREIWQECLSEWKHDSVRLSGLKLGWGQSTCIEFSNA